MKDRKTLLVVDDEPNIHRLVRRRCTTFHGLTIMSAQNGPDCISMARARKPDLILLDIVMPGMDGGDVASVLADDPALSEIPVVFFTGAVSCEEADKTGGLIGAEYFISKESGTRDFIDNLDYHLSRARAIA